MTPYIGTSPARNFLRGRGPLLVIPIAVFILAVLLANNQGPYNGAYLFDPEYAYLFNSLTILFFHMPGHIDHPGTTLQLFGAFIVFCKWLLGSLLGPWVPLHSAV